MHSICCDIWKRCIFCNTPVHLLRFWFCENYLPFSREMKDVQMISFLVEVRMFSLERYGGKKFSTISISIVTFLYSYKFGGFLDLFFKPVPLYVWFSQLMCRVKLNCMIILYLKERHNFHFFKKITFNSETNCCIRLENPTVYSWETESDKECLSIIKNITKKVVLTLQSPPIILETSGESLKHILRTTASQF